jgi:hypothetical protein
MTTRTDEQVTEFAAQIAKESWKDMNQVYRDYLAEQPEDDDSAMDDCEVNLYIYANGSWTIDSAQYLQDHRDIVAVIGLQQVNGPMELAEQIEQEYDDDCVAQESIEA